MIWRKKEKKKAQYQFNSERVFLVATQPAKTAYSYFQTSSVGLSEEEIGQRQSAYGKNEISREQKKNPLVLFIRTFINPFIGVLTALAVISLVIDVVMARPEDREWTAVLIIISMVVCSAILRFWQEWKASEATDSLMKMVKNTCFVKRFSGSEEVDITELVPGDVVCLAAGDMIPADIRIIESKDLFVSQASLTGESDPVEKFPEINGRRHSHGSVIELDNICYMGSTVISGSAKGIVFGTGNDTYLGTIARSLVGERATTAFDKGISKVSFLLIRFMLVMVPFVFFVNGFTKGDWFEAFIFALSVAVGLTPEMLPMIVTANLSKGAVSMSKKKTVVKNLNAIQNFGAMNILCTDKTGTLTQNLMQVHEPNFYGLKNNGQLGNDDLSKLVMEGISANSTAFLEEEVTGEKPKGVGNPTEVALLLWLNSQGCDYLALREKATVIDQLTFSTERKFMATLVQSPLIGKKVLYVKGAPEIVLGKCKDVMLDGKRVDAVEYRSTVEAQLLNYQNMAMRTLGFAFKIVDDAEASDCVSLVAENDLSFLGVVAISDPIRPDVPAAVAKCQSAGIGVKIVTGDTPGTATEIARQIGLWKPEDTEKNRITGAAFAELTDEEALDRVMDLKIMSRARPTDKQRLVQLLQQKGAVVAVTGDGTNDAPALNHAQVGLSMGTGTSVAKEASDITLLDDSFNSIGTAVMWGRSLYKNIQRFIVFQLTINFVALFIVLLGSLVGTTLPLTVTQMLWVNLIMDTFAALALASIPPSESVMKEKPRKSTDFIITKSMRYYILGMGFAFLVLLMGMLFWFNSEEGGMTTYRLTVFFTFFVMLQFWNLFNARVFGTSDSAFKGISKSYGMELIILAILGGQILIVQFGGAVFRTVPLDFMTWMTIVVSTSFVLWIGELVRLIRRLTQK